MSGFIRFPWAVSGDKTAIDPTTQPSGDVSLQEGYGEDYSRDLRSDPAAKSVERAKFNWFMNLMTSATRFLQMHGGVPEFITTADNGGTPFSYDIGVRVRYDNGSGYQTYQSRIINNTSLPTVGTDWFVVNSTTGVPDGQIVDASVASNAAINASKIANGTVTNAQFQYLSGVTSAIQTQLDAKQATITGGASTIVSSNLTASRALSSDASGKVAVATTTLAELNFVNGVTSAIQTQLDAKQATITGGASTIVSSNLTASRALVSDASGKVVVSAVTSTQLGYVSGVTSAIQTQLNGKQATGNYIIALTGDVVATGPGSVAATIQPNAVTTAKILDANITTAKIADSNVTTGKLANNAVTTAKMDTTGVTPGTYYNANVQIDAAGRVITAASGANPFGLLEGFETWSGGLPNTLPWTSPNTANIAQSALHVTQGTSSLAFSGTAEINVAGQNLTNYGEVNLDVFVGTAPAGSFVRLTVGANSVQTTTATTGTFKLRCAIPSGATTMKIESVNGSIAWVDNMQYVVLVDASGVRYNATTVKAVLDGLGTAATQNVGTAIGNVVQLQNVGGIAKLPAVDGSQLTNVPSGAFVILSEQTVSNVAQVVFTSLMGPAYDYYEVVWTDVFNHTDATSLQMRFSTNNGSSYFAGASDYTDTVGNKSVIDLSGSNTGIVRTTMSLSGNCRIFNANGILRKATIVDSIYCMASAPYIAGLRQYSVFSADNSNNVDAIRIAMSSGNVSGKFTLIGRKV